MKKATQKTVDELRPIDDVLFHKLSENRYFCEELLRCILKKPDLIIIENIPQRSLKNIHGRSVILDLLCQDSEHNYYNVEIQKDNHDNHQRRVRYNGANVDTYVMEKGRGFHEVYINAENDDGSDIADLMSIFKSVDVTYDQRFPQICDAIRYYKQGKGQSTMCEVVENYAKEYAEEMIIQIAKNMIKNGFDLNSISENTGLPMEQIMELI